MIYTEVLYIVFTSGRLCFNPVGCEDPQDEVTQCTVCT